MVYAWSSVDRGSHRPHMPDLVAVLADCPVGGELAGARRVEDRHASPSLPILPGCAHPLLAPHILGVIGEHQEWIRLHEVINKRPQHLAFVPREMAARYQIECAAQLRVGID